MDQTNYLERIAEEVKTQLRHVDQEVGQVRREVSDLRVQIAEGRGSQEVLSIPARVSALEPRVDKLDALNAADGHNILPRVAALEKLQAEWEGERRTLRRIVGGLAALLTILSLGLAIATQLRGCSSPPAAKVPAKIRPAAR